MAKLTELVGIGPAISNALFDNNIKTVEDLAATDKSELMKIHNFSETRINSLLNAATTYLQNETRLKLAHETDEHSKDKKNTTNKTTDQPKESNIKEKKGKKGKKKDKQKNKKNDKKKDKKKKGKK